MSSYNTKDEITFEELSAYFHLPVHQVSKELGICATVLKKICRKNGIPRWPHRKIKSLDRLIEALEGTVPTSPADEERIQKEIAAVKEKRRNLLQSPKHLQAAHGYKPVVPSVRKRKQTVGDAPPLDLADLEPALTISSFKSAAANTPKVKDNWTQATIPASPPSSPEEKKPKEESCGFNPLATFAEVMLQMDNFRYHGNGAQQATDSPPMAFSEPMFQAEKNEGNNHNHFPNYEVCYRAPQPPPNMLPQLQNIQVQKKPKLGILEPLPSFNFMNKF